MRIPTQLSDRVRLRFTRQGIQAVCIAVFCLFGAVVRDLNLLVILAGLIGSSVWIQWRWGRRNLQHISATQRLPNEVFAGQTFPVIMNVSNENPHRRLFQLTLSESIRHVKRGLKIHASGSSSFVAVAANQRLDGCFECLTARRGQYRYGPISIESTFPFGLLRASRTIVDSQASLVVFPQLVEVRRDWRAAIRKHTFSGSRPGNRAAHHEGQFFGLRTWQPGDNRRWIHWRTTARIGELAVRQFEHPRGEEMLLLVDLAETGKLGVAGVERAISLSATILEIVTRTSAFQFGIGIAGAKPTVTAGSSTTLVRSEALNLLAAADGAGKPEIEQLLVLLGGLATNHWPLVVISTRPRSNDVWTGAAGDWLDRRGGAWIDISDPTTNDWVSWSTVNAKN